MVCGEVGESLQGGPGGHQQRHRVGPARVGVHTDVLHQLARLQLRLNLQKVMQSGKVLSVIFVEVVGKYSLRHLAERDVLAQLELNQVLLPVHQSHRTVVL